MKIFSLVFFLCAILFYATASYAQEEVPEWMLKKIDAEVFEVNYDNSTLTVKYLQDIETLTYDQIVFKVKETTKIMRGEDITTLDDIAVGDNVKVRYYVDKYGAQQIVDVTVMI